MKYSINLNGRERDFLLEHLPSSNRIINRAAEKNDSYSMLVCRAEVEHVLSSLTDLLCRIGLNEKDQPNEDGIIIEGLIDRFNRQKW